MSSNATLVSGTSSFGKASSDATFCVGVSSSVVLTFERIIAIPEGLRSPRLSSTASVVTVLKTPDSRSVGGEGGTRACEEDPFG